MFVWVERLNTCIVHGKQLSIQEFMVDQSVNGRSLLICLDFIYIQLSPNTPLGRGAFASFPGSPASKSLWIPHKQNVHKLCSLRTQAFTQHCISSETHLMLKCSTGQLSMLQMTQMSYRICHLQMQPHLLLSHMFFQFQVLNTDLFLEVVYHFQSPGRFICLTAFVIFSCIYLFIHVFVPHLVPKWLSGGLQEYTKYK